MSHSPLARPETSPVRDLAADLADFAAGIDVATLDTHVVDAVQANILDTVSCAVAGSTAPAIDVVHSLVKEWGGAPQADVWVHGGMVPAHHAAWLNSSMAHARDYDDTHDAAILHAGISCVPSAIAAGQLSPEATGADLVAAVAAGLETMCRLGTAIEVDIVVSGFIYSALLGYFGATAAAGRMLKLSPQQMWDAFGIVFSSVAGNHQVSRDASLMKRMQPGLAAQAGVVAAQLAQRGVRGVRNVFDGADGFSRIYLQGRLDNDTARAGLGERFELLNLSYKPYPCCRDTHSAVDAVLAVRKHAHRRAEEIRSIRVGVTAPGYQMVCTPEAVRAAPQTIVEAQFSIPYAVAAAWIDGGVRLEHFTDEGVRRKDILELAAKVTPFVDEAIDRDWRRFVTPAAVSVEFTDGQTAHARVDYAKGHPTNPMSTAEVTDKAANCTALAAQPLTDGLPQQLLDITERLSLQADLTPLTSLLAPRHGDN
ncbi:MmgE/PrpD family protein [Streptomyces sp. NPDC058321]|uniref:MmgE/PrpD family protein n=1 Tax=Streptomyces sp. NPDC058321 TaxID=3346445 RepID=UPI0036E8BD51